MRARTAAGSTSGSASRRTPAPGVRMICSVREPRPPHVFAANRPNFTANIRELSTTTGGGTPYGPSHVALNGSDEGLTQDEKVIAQTLGKRIATIALKLKPAHS